MLGLSEEDLDAEDDALSPSRRSSMQRSAGLDDVLDPSELGL